jgi:galactokinase
MTASPANGIAEKVAALQSRFADLYREKPKMFRAPGRVNLIGEHTDYNDGFVMPAAINFYSWVAASPRNDAVLHAWSEQYRDAVEIPLEQIEGAPRGHWSDYVRGMAGVLLTSGHKLRGANLLIDGQVPLGAGLSSSAALELSVGLALACISEVDLPRLELVALSQKAEHIYAGAMCGIMDQFVAGFGQQGNAILLDCRSLAFSLVPISERVRLVICNSKVKHALAGGEYNTRRAECATAVKAIQGSYPEVRALRDVTLAMLENGRGQVSEVVYRRARHVITENERVLNAGAALKDDDLKRFGALMFESHKSLRDDYEVSCEELDVLVELAAGNEGLIGARMTGGGFGGCTVNLVQAEGVEAFQRNISQAYKRSTGRDPDVFVCSAADSAEQIHIEGGH